MRAKMEVQNNANAIPATLDHPPALRFWQAVVGIGILTGLAAGLLPKLLEWVQQGLWGGSGRGILDAARNTPELLRFARLPAPHFRSCSLGWVFR
jgi:hypothetical protein